MDRETSQRLYNCWYMKLYSYSMALTKEKALAEEITQETFYRAIAGSRAFRGDSGEFTWLCAIAKNLFYDELRKRSRQTDALPELPSAEEDGPEQTALDKDASLRIHLALHTLEEPYKEVFSLRVFGELSFAGIGTVFGKTENWARVTYHRAKLKLQERMGQK